MRTQNYNVEVMDHMKECGFVSCIHCASGYCTNGNNCDLYERHLKQED
ncbi:MAG: hypothetical protein K0R93_2805 [Anaerosolibacter sp.]|nr:hypothetical protein [Anaerosolibacter sp.]